MEQEVKTILLHELPELLEHDPQIRESVWRLMNLYFAPKQETESRFDRVLGEIQRMRQESERKWDEQKRKWDENQAELRQMCEESERKWKENQAELRQMREESERKWQEQKRKDAEQRQESERKWKENQAELRQMREESERKWQEQQELNHQMLAEIAQVDKKTDKKIQAKIGALGARWGIDSETAFRNGLRGILEEVAQVQVLHVNEFDDEGVVFGRPDQVELDIVIRNGVLMVCEMKSSVSKGDVAIFERKVQFYEQRHQRSVTHKVIISPMVDRRALPLIEQFSIHVYYNAEDVVLDGGDGA